MGLPVKLDPEEGGASGAEWLVLLAILGDRVGEDMEAGDHALAVSLSFGSGGSRRT